MTKQRNLHLEKKNAENSKKIRELTETARKEAAFFNTYQSQVKEDKEKAESDIFNLEKDKKNLENDIETQREKFE